MRIALLTGFVLFGLLSLAQVGAETVPHIEPDSALVRLREMALSKIRPWEEISHSSVQVRERGEVFLVRWQVGQKFPVKYYKYNDLSGDLVSVTIQTDKTRYYTFAADGRLIVRREGNVCHRDMDGLLVRQPCAAKYVLTALPDTTK